MEVNPNETIRILTWNSGLFRFSIASAHLVSATLPLSLLEAVEPLPSIRDLLAQTSRNASRDEKAFLETFRATFRGTMI